MSSGGGGSSTTVQKADPWSGQQPYLTRGFQEAEKLYNSGGPEYFPNATYVPFSGQTETGLDMISNRAMQGSPINTALQGYVGNTLSSGAANDSNAINMLNRRMMADPSMQDIQGGMQLPSDVTGSLQSTLRGGYLGQNPWLDDTYRRAVNSVKEQYSDTILPGINATFSNSGRTGGGLHGEMYAKAADELGDDLEGLATNIYGNNYLNERNNQMQAASMLGGLNNQSLGLGNQLYSSLLNNQLGAANALTDIRSNDMTNQARAAAFAPSAANVDYQDAQQLLNVGGAVEGKAGEMLGDTMSRFNYYQQRPEDSLSRYIAAIQGNYGGTSTSKQTGGGSNPIVGAAGGALTASALGGALGGSIPALSFLGGPWGLLGGAVLGGLLS